jgi:hypothetical protein
MEELMKMGTQSLENTGLNFEKARIMFKEADFARRSFFGAKPHPCGDWTRGCQTGYNSILGER